MAELKIGGKTATAISIDGKNVTSFTIGGKTFSFTVPAVEITIGQHDYTGLILDSTDNSQVILNGWNSPYAGEYDKEASKLTLYARANVSLIIDPNAADVHFKFQSFRHGSATGSFFIDAKGAYSGGSQIVNLVSGNTYVFETGKAPVTV